MNERNARAPKAAVLSIVCLVAVAAVVSSTAVYAVTRFKIATLAPEGTTWMKVMQEMADEVKKSTAGEVDLRFYAGGVMGDEGDVIRKMRFGQLHGGGFTGRGLGEINSEERVLELPMLFDNYKEVDCVLAKLTGRLASGFEKNGFVHLGWAEAGFVYAFTNKPIRRSADMKGVKMWMWEGDPLAKALCEANHIVPVPLDLPNVFTSMQTGLIDAVYSTPYAIVSLQWHTRIKYMVPLKLTYASGALLVSKKQFDALSAEQQRILRETVARHLKHLTELTRKENDEALGVLKKAGVETVELESANERSAIEKASVSVYDKLVGALYPRELLETALRARDECRGGSR